MTVRATFALALVAIAAGAAPASAQPTPPGAAPTADPPAKLRARALVSEGNRLSGAGRKADALSLFEDAFREYPDPIILVNIGITLRELGRLVDAAEALQRSIDDPTAAPEIVARATAELAQVDRSLGRLVLEPETMAAAPVEVAVDDEPWRLLPPSRTLHVLPGARRVRARGGGATVVVEVAVAIAAGAEQAVPLRLIDEPPPPPPPPPVITVAPVAARLPAPERPERPDVAAGRPGRFGATVGLVVDPSTPGAAALIAIAIAAHPRLTLDLGGLVGGNNALLVSATGAVSTGRLRPTVSVGGVVAFYRADRPTMVLPREVARTLVGARVAAGLEYWRTARLGLRLEAAVEYYPSGQPDIHPLIFTPTIAARARL
ncbi:MAG: tetratricopeptide repeat protein [Kofleriaceae bacterium]